MERQIAYALMGTMFTFGATALGAALVFLFKKEIHANLNRIFLGFAAGVMIAASVWSLLMPAIEMAEELNQNALLMAASGFICGGLFLLLLDRFIPHMHPTENKIEGVSSSFKRTTMLVLAVTLHNIPEGMAVGLTFALSAQMNTDAALASAFALAIGMGLQNFPEGAAISLPLKKEGFSNRKAFLYGALSGIVEPIAGVITVLLASQIIGIMPFVLSFAAGAMIYVVVEELIPEARLSDHSHSGTMGVMSGFLIMMILDLLFG